MILLLFYPPSNMMSNQSLLHNVRKEMEFRVHYIREGTVYTAVLVDDTLLLRDAIK